MTPAPVETVERPPLEEDMDVLWGADPNCAHDVKDAPGGGVKCTKCPGWFCY